MAVLFLLQPFVLEFLLQPIWEIFSWSPVIYWIPIAKQKRLFQRDREKIN